MATLNPLGIVAEYDTRYEYKQQQQSVTNYPVIFRYNGKSYIKWEPVLFLKHG